MSVPEVADWSPRLRELSPVKRALLAARLAQQRAGRSSLLALQPEGTRQPFFCVHPVGGSSFCYVDLARAMGTQRPFYGLQVAELYDGSVRAESIVSMASRYVAAIQNVSVDAPYLLGGWSLGGVIALEMAYQMTARNVPVAGVLMMDSIGADGTDVDELPTPADLAVGFARVLGVVSDDLAALEADLLRSQADDVWTCVYRFAQRVGALPPAVTPAQCERLIQVYQNCMHAWYEHTPRDFGGSVTLLRAMDQPEHGAADSDAVWRRLFGDRLNVHHVPGDHYSMLDRSHSSVLAATVRQCLENFENSAR